MTYFLLIKKDKEKKSIEKENDCFIMNNKQGIFMKVRISINKLFDIFPQYKKELTDLVEEYSQILESHNFKIEQIKDKSIKSIFETQLSTKEDFNLQVQLENKKWIIKNYDAKTILPLLLRDEVIILDWEEKNLENIDVIEYLEKTYHVYASNYEGSNYVGEGKINWEAITKEIKENWDNSFFFLDNMNNKQFVENNKELILEKVKNNEEILKEALLKSSVFFKYALNNINPTKLLVILAEKEGYLADIWNTKIKDIFKKSDANALLKEAQEQMNEELESYFDFIREKSINQYGEYNHYTQYGDLKQRLLKELKNREKEIKKEVEENQKNIEEIKELLKDEKLKINIIKGLLKNEIFKEEFKFFESDIIENQELRNLVIKNGLYKTLSVTKNFVDSLNEEELAEFIENCNKNLKNSLFNRDDKKHFSTIVSEEQLIKFFRRENNFKLEILSEYKTKNKELKKYIYKTNPKELFSELLKSEIDDEDIRIYLNSGGYLSTLKEKINIYEITDVETIKVLCEKYSQVLNSKKVPIKWKTNPEIITAALKENSSLEDVGLSKEHVLELSKDIEFTIEVVRKDKSNIFYKLLPEKLKNNRKIALGLLDSRSKIEDIIKILPGFILMDKKFNIELIKHDSSSIKFLKPTLWDDKEFVLTLFNEIKNSEKEKQLKEQLPEKIKLFLETFNIEENYYTFFNNYYLQKKLQTKLVDNETRPKDKKLKI